MTDNAEKPVIKGLVTDIQHCSIHDGPGIRTTVFLKGCPLNCVWCHNPECISFEPEIMHYPEKCIGCGKCDQGCFIGAKVLCGKEMTVDEVMEEVLKDRPYYGSDGGVTISGGEPLAQHEFSYMLLKNIKECDDFSCAVETSLFASWDIARKVLELCDFIMCDLKTWDENIHKKYTGVPNGIIKENIKRLDLLGIPFVMRTLVVTGVNDNIDEISKIAEFASGFKNIQYYELLPYNPFGATKAAALGMKEYRKLEPVSSDIINAIVQEIKQYGIEIRTSGVRRK